MTLSLRKQNSLENFAKYLNYELSTSLLFFASLFAGIFLILALIAAILFTPYMLYMLYKEKKNGWIIFYFLLVALPLIVIFIISLTVDFIAPLLLIPLGLFYFYCFLLRFEVNSWIRERNAREQWIAQKKKSEEDLNNFMDQLKN
jgi:predicted neutral ceramidase superfamily lipid hydrolase